MNRRLITKLLIIFITSWSLLGAPLSAYAHGGEAHLELSTTQASPGAAIDLRGIDFDPESSITIMLVGAERQLLLSTIAPANRVISFKHCRCRLICCPACTKCAPPIHITVQAYR